MILSIILMFFFFFTFFYYIKNSDKLTIKKLQTLTFLPGLYYVGIIFLELLLKKIFNQNILFNRINPIIGFPDYIDYITCFVKPIGTAFIFSLLFYIIIFYEKKHREKYQGIEIWYKQKNEIFMNFIIFIFGNSGFLAFSSNLLYLTMSLSSKIDLDIAFYFENILKSIPYWLCVVLTLLMTLYLLNRLYKNSIIYNKFAVEKSEKQKIKWYELIIYFFVPIAVVLFFYIYTSKDYIIINTPAFIRFSLQNLNFLSFVYVFIFLNAFLFLAALNEELFFRFILIDLIDIKYRLTKKGNRNYTGYIVSSVLFVLLHLSLSKISINYLIFVFSMAIYLNILRSRFNNQWINTFTHYFINFFIIVVSGVFFVH